VLWAWIIMLVKRNSRVLCSCIMMLVWPRNNRWQWSWIMMLVMLVRRRNSRVLWAWIMMLVMLVRRRNSRVL
jgi:hypothetical protein